MVIMECSNCGAQIEENKKFCTECGTKIEPVKSLETKEINCPKCSTTLPPNTKFCTNWGTKIQGLKTAPTIPAKELPSDDPLDSLQKTGNELIKGVGGLFGKSKSKGSIFDKVSSTIDDTLSGMKDDSVGYLRCEKCHGYYKLQSGESSKDYDICVVAES